MSYDIDLIYIDGNIAEVDLFVEGGTYPIGGSNEASLNITYNYSRFYYNLIDKKKGIRWLYGKKASKTIKRLKKVIGILGIKRDDDYWKPTPGNAGYALSILLRWAEQHPNAIWQGD